MFARSGFVFLLIVAVAASPTRPLPGCCPAPPSGKPVVNADQTVVILWDAATKTQHFIRQASFKSQADDFGLLIPSPSRPELNESGNAAFPFLAELTAPAVTKMPRPPSGGGCNMACESTKSVSKNADVVQVLEQKQVAGFEAVVLQASSADALTDWLKQHGYAFSPEVEAWARPYVDAGWIITALQVAKPKDGEPANSGGTASSVATPSVATGALRMSFQTERPLFPYREPDTTAPAKSLAASHRLLRIYFLADARYRGELSEQVPAAAAVSTASAVAPKDVATNTASSNTVAWTGYVPWSGKLAASDRQKILALLNLPETSGPAEFWLTEFEDAWPYRLAPGDVYFARDSDQSTTRRPPIVQYVATPVRFDATICVVAAILTWRLTRRPRAGNAHQSVRPVA